MQAYIFMFSEKGGKSERFIGGLSKRMIAYSAYVVIRKTSPFNSNIEER